ncbi:UNVERIFIED_CONTAM: hypothetical protein K2H54_062025, partial [Gekko kuhli]
NRTPTEIKVENFQWSSPEGTGSQEVFPERSPGSVKPETCKDGGNLERLQGRRAVQRWRGSVQFVEGTRLSAFGDLPILTMDSENGKVQEAILQEASEEHLTDLKKERAHEGGAEELMGSKEIPLREEKETMTGGMLPVKEEKACLISDDLATADHCSRPVHPLVPASQAVCDPSLSPQDNDEKLTDLPESRGNELETEEESSSSEGLLIDEEEEEHINDNEALGLLDSEGTDLGTRSAEKEAADEESSSEEIVEAGSIGSREDESLPALGIEEIRKRYGDLCQSNTAFQEMMLSLKGDSSPISWKHKDGGWWEVS